jgi:hypothetical protein
MTTRTWEDRLKERIKEPNYGRESAMKEEIAELRAKLAEANEIIDQRNAMLSRGHAEFLQAITDPENQPSQFGTVTLKMYQDAIIGGTGVTKGGVRIDPRDMYPEKKPPG